MGLLDGDLQAMFGAAFGGLLLEGRHYHKTETRADNGDVTATVTKVQSVSGYREVTRNRRGGDEPSTRTMRFLVLQTYQGRVLNELARGDELALDGLRIVIGDIDTDPAHAAWIVEAALV
jgi:hypothetical protein